MTKNSGELLSVIVCRRNLVIRPFSIPLPTERHFRPLTLVCSRDPGTGKVKQICNANPWILVFSGTPSVRSRAYSQFRCLIAEQTLCFSGQRAYDASQAPASPTSLRGIPKVSSWNGWLVLRIISRLLLGRKKHFLGA